MTGGIRIADLGPLAGTPPRYDDLRETHLVPSDMVLPLFVELGATAPRSPIPSMPGVDRFSVDGAVFEQLKRMSRELGFEQKRQRQRSHFFSELEAPPDREEELTLLNERFVRGNGFKVSSECDKTDLEENLRWIKEARRQGMDLVGIYHSHPDCDAYFSKTDLENSCPWYSFIVLSIQKGEFHHANSWLPNAEQTKAEKEELIYA